MTPFIAALTDPAARAAAEAARQRRLKDSASRMAKAKTGCGMTLAGTAVVCRDPAVGLCEPCTKAFCEPHGSIDIGSVFLRVPDLCWECQSRLIKTSLAEHDNVTAMFKARTADRRSRDRKKLAKRRLEDRMPRWDHWARRSGSAILGLVLVAASGAAGLRVDHVLTEASVPVAVPVQGVAVTPFAVLAGLAVVLGLVALFYATQLGGAAARVGRTVAALGFVYLTVTLGVLLWRSRDGELDWVPMGLALGGASAWLVGGHLAHRPAAEVRAQLAGKPLPRHRDGIVALVVVLLFMITAGAAAYEARAAR